MKALSFFLLLLLAACSSPKILSSWTAPQAGRTAYKKILVVSLVTNSDSTLRQQMEEHLVGDLKAIGYNAVSFRQTFDEKAFHGIRYDSARARFQREGIDGVITIGLLAREKETLYVPDKSPLPSDPMERTNFWDYYTRLRETVGRPGYYVNSTNLFWESNFYDLNTLDLLYHVRSEFFDPASTQKLAHAYGRKIVSDLQKTAVLSSR